MAKMHWTIGSLPELGHLPRDCRRDIINRVRPGRVYASIVTPSGALGFITGLAIWIAATDFGASDWSAGLLAAMAGLTVAGMIYQLQIVRIRKALRGEMRRLLAGDRLPVCLTCGYDLTGTQSPRCPECGAVADVPQTPSD